MSGHNKWSSIKHKKKINDEKRSKLFSKLTKDIKLSLVNGYNLKQNCKLKNAVSRALNKNLNKSIIHKIITLKTFDNKEKFLYCGNSLFDSIFVIECFNENSNKIISELKCLFTQYSGTLIKYNDIEKFFNKFIKIKIFDYYNEFILFNKFDYFCFYKFLNNEIIINLSNFLKIKEYFLLLNLYFNYNYEIIFKDLIKLKIEDLTYLLELKNEILKKQFVSNVFTNF